MDTRFEKYRSQLRELAGHVDDAAAMLAEASQLPIGADSGSLSNAPMHLADVGSDEYAQNLNAALLEHESYMRNEIAAALGRIDEGVYGQCERCRLPISADRLDAVPYTRYCARCAEMTSIPHPNINDGRPRWEDSRLGSTRTEPGTEARKDIHATGTAGGGTAIGGLAGTNIGHGDPDNADLEETMGSAEFDVKVDGPPEIPRSGHAGGAVGGTPANKRAV